MWDSGNLSRAKPRGDCTAPLAVANAGEELVDVEVERHGSKKRRVILVGNMTATAVLPALPAGGLEI